MVFDDDAPIFWGDMVLHRLGPHHGEYGIVVGGADNGNMILQAISSARRPRQWEAARDDCRLVSRRER